MKKRLVFGAVVFGAVLVLAYLLLEAVITCTEPGVKGQARCEAKAIEIALRVFLIDYSKFPDYGTCRLQSTGVGTTEASLTRILRGIETNANAYPRGKVYLDVSEKSVGTNATDYAGNQGQADVLYDPWGRPYNIAVDNQSSNLVVHADGETLSNRSVAVWSWGPNKSTKPDPNDPTHIRSWR